MDQIDSPWHASRRFLQIEPTTRCNFTCSFCCGRSMDQSDLAYAEFESALERFPNLEHVELQGEGEPLLHERFLDMVAALRRRQIRVSFITNGTLLNEARVARLLELGIERVSLSLESADPETFRSLRGGRLERSVAGLRRLRLARDQAGLKRPTLGLALTLLSRTQSDLPGVEALYRELQLDGGIAVQALNRMDAYYHHYSADLKRELVPPSLAEGLERALPSAAPETAPGFYGDLFAEFEPAEGRCPWLEEGGFLQRSGALTPCCMIKDVPRHGLQTTSSAPLNLKRLESLRRGLAEGPTPEPCRGCAVAEAIARARDLEPAPTELLQELGDLRGRRVLVVGCGEGEWCQALLRRAPSSEVWGVDPAPPLLERVPAGIKTQVAEPTRLPFPDGSFAAACAATPLPSEPSQREAALDELCRVVGPSGRVLIPGARLEIKDGLARRCQRVWRAPPNPGGPAWLAEPLVPA